MSANVFVEKVGTVGTLGQYSEINGLGEYGVGTMVGPEVIGEVVVPTREQLLRRAEQDMAYATTWINDSRRTIFEQKRLLLSFRQLRAEASADYAAALAMPEEAEPVPEPVTQGDLFGRVPLRESPRPPPDAEGLPFGGLLGTS